MLGQGGNAGALIKANLTKTNGNRLIEQIITYMKHLT